MKNNKTGRKNIIIGAAIVVVLIVGSAFAYFTDFDSKKNSFTVGNVSIELSEPEWNEDNAKDMTPEKEIAKDPQITNDGANDAYIFARVTVPAGEYTLADKDGTVKASARCDLFTYEVKDSWKEVKKIENEDSTVYTYAYVDAGDLLQVLAKAETTEPVFDTVKLVNIVEGQIDGETLEIDVDGLAIQATDLGTANPAEVLNILENQI